MPIVPAAGQHVDAEPGPAPGRRSAVELVALLETLLLALLEEDPVIALQIRCLERLGDLEGHKLSR